MNRLAASLLTALLLAAPYLSAQTGGDPFDPKFKFAAKDDVPIPKGPNPNDAAAKPQPKPKRLNPTTEAMLELISLKATAQPPRVRRGEVVRVTISGTTKPYAYTYSMIRKHPTQSGLPGRITYAESWVQPLFPIQESAADAKVTPEGTNFILHDRFQWTQEVHIAADAPIGKQTVSVVVRSQVCTKTDREAKTVDSCLPPGNYVPLELALEITDQPAVPPPADLKARTKAPPFLSDLNSPSTLTPAGAAPSQSDKLNFNDLGGLLFAAFLGAILMLLTPCVFPMIPITVNFFIKQSEREHHRPFFMAFVYAGTIILLLTAVMLIGGNLVIQLALDPWFNLGLGVVLIMFALGLFGMFEVDLTKFFGIVFMMLMGYAIAAILRFAIPSVFGQMNGFVLAVLSLILAVPIIMVIGRAIRHIENQLGIEESSVLRFLAAQESRGGALGAVFMAMTFTITSFSCTGPFLGILLAPLADARPPLPNLVLASLVYSITFAAPFFFLALFPAWLKTLPKSGGWMTTIKVTMGFLEIGAALKFLSNADFAWFPGNPRIFNYDTVLCSWIALSIACSFYLFGVFHLHHDTPEEHIGVVRMIFGSLFLGMAFYLTPLLFGITPKGLVMEAAVSFLPLNLDDGRGHGGGGGSNYKDIPWVKDDYPLAWEKAVKENKLLFIDFTGVNCANCRENERNVLSKAEVVQELKKYVPVALFTDFAQKPNLSSQQASELAERHLGYQKGLVNTVTQPTYIIIDPSAKSPFDDSGERLSGQFLGKRDGKIFDVPDFLRFLREPLEKKQAARAVAHPIPPS